MDGNERGEKCEMLALPEARPLFSTNRKNKNKFVVHLHCFLVSVTQQAIQTTNTGMLLSSSLPAVIPERREEPLLA